ncbi:hypothetical protein L218DRAFT_950897 [Marasmius fiardii PR-910]|nr:hypothetical protein L218DRAFT_950897 [Marasmius fiardii PR-910]
MTNFLGQTRTTENSCDQEMLHGLPMMQSIIRREERPTTLRIPEQGVALSSVASVFRKQRFLNFVWNSQDGASGRRIVMKISRTSWLQGTIEVVSSEGDGWLEVVSDANRSWSLKFAAFGLQLRLKVSAATPNTSGILPDIVEVKFIARVKVISAGGNTNRSISVMISFGGEIGLLQNEVERLRLGLGLRKHTVPLPLSNYFHFTLHTTWHYQVVRRPQVLISII